MSVRWLVQCLIIDIKHIYSKKEMNELGAHLLTMLISSLSFPSPVSLSLSLASASRPLRMGSSKRFLNSWAVPALQQEHSGWRGSGYPADTTQTCLRLCVRGDLPRIPAFTKWTRLKYSSRSFWMGVPDISTLRWALMAFRAWYVWLSEFFSRWP